MGKLGIYCNAAKLPLSCRVGIGAAAVRVYTITALLRESSAEVMVVTIAVVERQHRCYMQLESNVAVKISKFASGGQHCSDGEDPAACETLHLGAAVMGSTL